MSVPYSPASEASTSGSNGPVCELCGSASRTSSARQSSLTTGLESRSIPTCAPLWPTPVGSVAQLGEGPQTWLERREQVKAKGINGNGMGMPLTIAVQMDPMDWTDGKCPCRCHTSTSSAADSPAKTSATPAPEPGSTGHARVFGRSTPVSFASYDPATSSWRTSQLSLLEGSDEFSETWPRSGMTRNGTAYRLQPLAPLTGATVSGLWPTPHGMPKPGQHRRPGPSGNELGRAVNQAEREWPTPTTADAHGGPGNSGRAGGMNLRTAVKEWATPTSHPRTHTPRQVDHGVQLANQAGGPLNPTWVEWLMGFPLGWTDLPHWATRSSRKSRNGSGIASSPTKRSD